MPGTRRRIAAQPAAWKRFMTTTPQGQSSPSLPITRPEFGETEIEALRGVLASGWVTQGPVTREFERLFAARHQVDFALATTSCTAALHLAVMALGLKADDEVIVPSFTWVTSAHCAEYVGAKVAFCDIDPATLNIDLDSAASVINSRTRAIIPIHLFGLAADMDRVNELARRHGLAVIEDAACAVGSTYKGKPVGGFGELGCFSFHPRKVITTGEGGMVTTRDADLAARVGALRNHGANPRMTPRNPKPYQMGVFDQIGYNLRLSDIQAAVGVAQMARLDTLLEHRVRMARGYHDRLRDLTWLRIPEAGPEFGHSYQSYVIWVGEQAPLARNAIMEQLAAKGIQTRPGTLAVHCIPYYHERYGLRAEQLPISHAAQESTITLPIFPGMSEQHLDYVTEALRAVQQAPYSVRRAG
jgi:dTDP-4-amino-4,6-dideoxygalactose transaminase